MPAPHWIRVNGRPVKRANYSPLSAMIAWAIRQRQA